MRRHATHLAAVNMIALRLPNVDAATNSGIHQAITPSISSANVYAENIAASESKNENKQ